MVRLFLAITSNEMTDHAESKSSWESWIHWLTGAFWTHGDVRAHGIRSVSIACRRAGR